MAQHDEFFFIDGEDMPCLYELSWDEHIPAIVIKMHRDFVESCFVSAEAPPIICHFMGNFGFFAFDCFRPNLFGEQLFGFDGAFQKVKEEKDFMIFEARIPQVEKQLNEACHECNGTKQDRNLEGKKCLYCKGTGREMVMDWKPAYAISATFTIFSSLASFMHCKKHKTSCAFPQLLTVETITEKEQHGGSLYGVYSIPLARFLSSFEPNTEIIEITRAMIKAWDKMFGKTDKYERLSFWAKVANKNGWLNVSCPGDACGLHPEGSWEPRLGEGYKFSCHNVDSPMQQISLLAGLAALCDKARKEIKSC
jgi:hypothetical protein